MCEERMSAARYPNRNETVHLTRLCLRRRIAARQSRGRAEERRALLRRKTSGQPRSAQFEGRVAAGGEEGRLRDGRIYSLVRLGELRSCDL